MRPLPARPGEVEMVNPVEANQTATAAADEAGTRAADSTTVSCDLIRVGVFFDGTGNSRNHAGRGEVSWHTNVDFLGQVYEDTGGPVEREVNGQTRRVNYGRRYARGIGVEAGGGTTNNGMGRGMGPEGVRQRVEQTVNFLRADLRQMASGMEVCHLWFDAFGFSRGAAAARHFANIVQEGELTVQSADPDVKFLGLFDTVVMIGLGVATTGADDDVDVGTRNVADRIVHITADDEIRHNFPLTRAYGEQRIRMVGVHSDIGGGYDPSVRNDQRGSFEFEHEDYPGLPTYLSRNWGLDANRPTGSNTQFRSVGADTESPDTLVTELQGGMQFYDWDQPISTFSWTCEHGLQFVSLHLMHKKAVDAGVPFLDLTTGNVGEDVSMDDTLSAYYSALLTGSVRSEQTMAIRLRYSHVSFNADARAAGLVHPNVPRENGRRQVDIQ